MMAAAVSRSLRSVFPPLLVLLIGATAYSSSLGNGFVWDDALVVSGNQWIQDMGNLRSFFGPEYLEGSGESTHRPVVTITYLLDYALWGKDPFGFHLTNLLLHLVNSILVLMLSSRLLSSRWAGFLSAAAFSCHPALTEAVNGIAFREDLLCMAFCLTSWLCFRGLERGAGGRKMVLWTGCIAGFIFALYSKETAAVLPAVLAADLLILGREGRWTSVRGALLRLIPLMAVLSVFSALFLTVLKGAPDRALFPDRWSVLCTMPMVLHQYLKLMLLPVDLRALYDRPTITSQLSWEALYCIGVLATLAGLAVLSRRREPLVTFAICYFFLTIAPVSHLFFSFWVLIAERFLYMPILSFCWVLSIGAQRAWFIVCQAKGGETARIAVGWACAALLLAYVYSTHERNPVWKDSLSLWSDTVIKAPRSAAARNNLGIAYKEAGFLDLAMEQYEVALKIYPRDPDVHNNMGDVWVVRRDTAKALEEYAKAISIDPCMKNSLRMSGYLHLLEGRGEEAWVKALEFQRCFPKDPEAHRLMGLIFFAQGREEEARDHVRRFLLMGGDPSLNPDIRPLMRDLGLAQRE
ncbi:MAG: tetratricopeptide repeat protein [Thermodesulfobacteriota bacterium]